MVNQSVEWITQDSVWGRLLEFGFTFNEIFWVNALDWKLQAMQNMTLIKNSRKGYHRQSTNTKHTRKCLTSLTKVDYFSTYVVSSFFSFDYRISLGFKTEIRPNLFWHNFLYEDNKIQIDNIWRQVVSHRRNYGTSHWMLNH